MVTNARLRTMYDAVPCGIITVDSAGIITSANPFAVMLFGVDPVGTMVEEYMAARHAVAHHMLRKSFDADGRRNMVGRPVLLLRGDGESIPVLIGLQRLEDGEVLATLSDMGEVMQGQKALMEANEELRQFAYSASHDLQAPLRGITTRAMILTEEVSDDLDESSKASLARIKLLAHRGLRMVHGLLSLTRVYTRGADMGQVDLAALAEELAMLHPCVRFARNNGSVFVQADAAQLRTVVDNLVSNAIKYTPKGQEPVVVVSIVKEGSDFVGLSVQDSGIGISEKYRDRIWEIFKRLHHDDEYEGDGIGLALVKKIVERHEGRVGLESEEGTGSRFWFVLPVRGPRE